MKLTVWSVFPGHLIDRQGTKVFSYIQWRFDGTAQKRKQIWACPGCTCPNVHFFSYYRTYMYKYHIYIYIYIERERESYITPDKEYSEEEYIFLFFSKKHMFSVIIRSDSARCFQWVSSLGSRNWKHNLIWCFLQVHNFYFLLRLLSIHTRKSQSRDFSQALYRYNAFLFSIKLDQWVNLKQGSLKESYILDAEWQWSGLKIQGSNWWPSTVTLTLSLHCWVISSHKGKHLTQVSWKSFKGFRRYGANKKEMNDLQLWPWPWVCSYRFQTSSH